jgi:hypothetical protein
MLRVITAAVIGLLSGLAHSESIERVIERTDREIIKSKRTVAVDLVPAVYRSFNKIHKAAGAPDYITVKVTVLDGSAVTVGTTVLASITLDRMTEVQRDFIFAHEIAHVVLGHQQALKDLWKKHVPGNASQDAIDAGRISMEEDLKRSGYASEYAADEYAIRLLIRLGYTRDQVVDGFLGFERFPNTATHPSTIRRAMRLRDLPL